jgi:hypothetical protein
MSDTNCTEEKKQQPTKEERVWAWAIFGAAMLPGFMYPGNLGPLGIATGLLFFGFPAYAVGSFLGKHFGVPHFNNRLLLVILCVVIFAFMVDYFKHH